MPSAKFKLAIDEATQAYQLADDAVHGLYRLLCAENPLAADLFMATLTDSSILRHRLEQLQAATNEKSK